MQEETSAMDGVEREDPRRMIRPLRFGIAAMALWVGIVATPAPVVAWADSTGSNSSATVQADKPNSSEAKDAATSDSGAGEGGQDEPETTGPLGDDADPDADDTDTDTSDADAEAVTDTDTDTDEASDTEAVTDTDEASDADDSSDTSEPQAEVANPVEPESAATPEDLHEQAPAGSTSGEPVIPDDVVAEVNSSKGQAGVAAEVEPDRDEHRPEVAPSPAAGVLTLEVPTAQLMLAEPSAAAQADTSTSTLVAVTSETAVEEATPTAPQPLSPLAELLQLPGRLINALLQVFDLTESASSPPSPISFEPINNLLFAAFRELERLFGLDRTPPVLPSVPTLTYDGPTTAPTPTVAQFLNASAAGYVLGATPGGLVPFTVNGFQVVSTNIFSGMVGKAWVTPEGQVIIAYQGTTGGSHLLF
ncbi:MAG: hypothetical protein U1D00_20645, partial [Mycobacterium sp.]|nr:hypothetical protein [Mycobacterium sp.]